ncbi:MAG: hypothetical protein ACYSU5_18665 [Planctomycetota bacterium]|jgi:hypothetical protein
MGNKIAEESKPSSFQPKPLDDEWSKWLVGEWEIPVDSDVGAGSRSKIELGLNGQFLIMKDHGELGEMTDEQIQQLKETTNASDEDIERFLSMPFKELQIHTIDPKTGEIVGYLFDSMRCIAAGRGRRQGNKEIIEWKWSGTAQGATKKISDNKFIGTQKYTLPDGNKMEEKIELIRRKTKTEK